MDIQPYEDDTQYERRKTQFESERRLIQRALDPAPDLSRDELAEAESLLERARDWEIHANKGLVASFRSELGVAADGDYGPCFQRLVVVTSQWLPKYDQLIEQRNASAMARQVTATSTTQNAERQAVLSRRFAPVVAECQAQVVSQSPKCGELPGLSDDERVQCQRECARFGAMGYRAALQQARTSCASLVRAPKCEVKAPASVFPPADQLKADLVTCARDCREDRKAAAEARIAAAAEARADTRARASGPRNGTGAFSRSSGSIEARINCFERCEACTTEQAIARWGSPEACLPAFERCARACGCSHFGPNVHSYAEVCQ